MENLLIEGSPKTPTVNFDSQNGIIELKGRSIPENSVEFYQPLQTWVELYSQNPKEETTVEIKLEYFNTSSSKCILDLFKKLEIINKSSSKVLVKWYFETDDEDMQEAGEDYQEIIGLPFKMIEVEEI